LSEYPPHLDTSAGEDQNAGRIVQVQIGIAEVGVEIYDLLLEVASGRKTKPETLGFEDL
jgi:altronate dehydratase